jgi:fructokinase
VMGGRPLHGVLHPEMGHVRTARAAGDDFGGVCPWHGDCLEGMASGPAIAARWGKPAGELPSGHEAWEKEAHYLAEACAGFLCTLSPQRVILGGGVMGVPGLLERVRAGVRERLGGYLQHPLYSGGLEDCVVAPGLGTRSGILGALALARQLVR